MNERLVSLDVFRGLTIAGMILVNNPGNWSEVYSPLLHAPWHGCTPTDLVFPFFLFIVGVSIALSTSNQLSKGREKPQMVRKILIRTAKLFGLGLFLSAMPYFELGSLRIPGVLQRIALCYGAAALIYLYTSWRTQVIIGGTILVLYALVMTLVPVPGHGPAKLEPGTNFAAWVDSILLKGHMWSQTKTWDPEGLLSTFPAVVTALSGALTGRWLLTDRPHSEKVVWLFVAGSLSIVLGLAWNLSFPINKALWTSSYVLYTSGIALQALALSYWFVDAQGFKGWTEPVVAYGANAITAYFVSSAVAKLMGIIQVAEGISLKAYLVDTLFGWMGPYNTALAGGLAAVLLFWIPMWIMYQRKIFIKI